MYAHEMERAKLEQEQNAGRLARAGQGARGRTTERRAGDGGQGRVPGEHEPRDPHADERDHGHDGPRAPHQAHASTAGLHQHGQRVRRGAADDHRRHPRRVEDRSRAPHARTDAVSLPRHGGGRRQAAGPASRREGAGAGVPHRAGRARRARRRRRDGCGRSSSIWLGTRSSSPTRAR